MKIQDALKKNGMARLPDSHGYKTYAQVGGGDQLRWWCDKGIGAGCHDIVSYIEIIREDWEPYIVEIKPNEITEIEDFNVSISNQFILGISTSEDQVVILDSQKILSYREIGEI